MYKVSVKGSSFMSTEVKTTLHGHGISISRSIPHNYQNNGVCERYNYVIWKEITLPLKKQTKNPKHLPIIQWEHVLLDVLHSMHTLLSTAPNALSLSLSLSLSYIDDYSIIIADLRVAVLFQHGCQHQEKFWNDISDNWNTTLLWRR